MSGSVQTYLRTQRISQTMQRWPWLYIEVQKSAIAANGSLGASRPATTP